MTHRAEYASRYMGSLLTEPVQFPKGAIDIMARRHFGENLELAPDYYGEDL